MIRFAPAAGLLLASPVVLDALRGRRGIDEALTALVIGVAAAALALWLLQLVSRDSGTTGTEGQAVDPGSPTPDPNTQSNTVS